jgi:hypothetical protein
VNEVYAEDLTELWHDVTRWHLEQDRVDLYLSIGTNLNNVFLQAEGADFDFNFREVWLNSQRWTRLVREYIDPLDLTRFVQNARTIFAGKGKNGVITQMPFRPVSRSDRKHKWGNCLLAATFRGTPGTAVIPTLTLHSRVSYNAYMLALDIGIAHCLAREIAGVDDTYLVRVQWHIDVLQLHSFKCLPYLYTQPDLMRTLEDQDELQLYAMKYPTWKSIERWWRTVQRYEREGKTLDQELYGPFRRIRRRYEEYKQGIQVPDLHISDLDFVKLGEAYNP